MIIPQELQITRSIDAYLIKDILDKISDELIDIADDLEQINVTDDNKKRKSRIIKRLDLLTTAVCDLYDHIAVEIG